MLQDQGFEDVAVLQGGMAGWEAANLLAAVDTLDE
jgi:rhodanese-related sulfurtransferase